MAQRKCTFLAAVLIAGLCAQMIFQTAFAEGVTSALFILLLAGGAVIVGQIPRSPRPARAQLVLRIIGWPMFVVEVAMMFAGCRMMLLSQEPRWDEIIGYVWVLAYLTWKVVLYPNSPSGGQPLWGQRLTGPLRPVPQAGGLLAHAHRDTGAVVMSGIAALRHHPVPARLPLPPYAVRDTGSVVLRGLAYLRFGSR